jgi:hypothetical protein
MATTADAEIILKLYTLRTEETMRKARWFVLFDLHPSTYAELRAVQTELGTERNAFYRQVMSYWEMAAGLVLHGAVDPELFFDSNGEGLSLRAKLEPFQAEHEALTGTRMMAKTGKLIEQYPTAKRIFEGAVKKNAARAAGKA